MQEKNSPPPYLTHPDFAPEGIAYGFFTRQGGVSKGFYATLNGGYGSADEHAAIAENRRLAVSALGFSPQNPCGLYQVHSSIAHWVSAPYIDSLEGDALATATPSLPLMILTADCVPVLFIDTESRIIAAAHAGWQGALGRIIETTVDLMVSRGASEENITALIGPAIQQQSYQVGDEMRLAAIAENPEAEKHFTADSEAGKYLFDLTGYVGWRLARCGVRHLSLPDDTYSDETHFFSHRRRTHRGEGDTGRLMSVIGLTG